MLFDTPPQLLAPVHSLLKKPFDFSAGPSIAMKLQRSLQIREDFEDLLALGCLFDEARQALAPSLASLRSLLESTLSLIVPDEDDLERVCRTKFQGRTPMVLHMDGARYLSHVSVHCQLERLYDHFDLRRSGHRNPLEVGECTEAIKFLMLSEALALSLAGIAAVKHCHGRFDLAVRNTAARRALRNTWFARKADESSHSATSVLARNLALDGAEHICDVEPLTARILEQDLSINLYGLSDAGRALRSVQQISSAAGLVALLSVLRFQDRPLRMSEPELRRHGLVYADVARLIQRQAGALVTDQFLIRQGNLLSLRFEAASKGLRTLFRMYETEFGEREALRSHVGGRFYEQAHIRRRIEQGDDYQPRYRIFEGFDADQVLSKVPSKCDIEYIIQDTEQNHNYFVQAKHALLGEEAFLRAIVEAIQDDIGKGLLQLREAKRLFEGGHLDSTLKDRGIVDAKPANSSFVLLHNIAQFDFQQTSDGISLYDWATFRNLLKDAECGFGRSDGPSELIRLPSPLIVTDPTTVIQRLLTEHPAYSIGYADPWSQERASTYYEVLSREIHVCGLGI